MSLQCHVNTFCKFFVKYHSDYDNNVTGNVIGSFKGNYKDCYNILIHNNCELNATNFCQFAYYIVSTANMDADDITTGIYKFINDAITKKPNYGLKSKFTDDHILYFKNFIDKANSHYNQIEISNPFVINETQLQTPTNTQTVETLDELNTSETASNSSLSQAEFAILLKQLEENLVTKLDLTINSRISSEMIKHLGIDRNLTSSEILTHKTKLGYTYQSILKKKNQINILKSHLDNSTTPEVLSHKKFPAPFFAFENNILYVNKHNNIIESAQKSLMQLEIDQFEEDLDILNNDVKVFKDTLKYHVTDIAKVDREIFVFQENKLKKTFESASIKALKIIAKPFIAKQSNNKSEKNPNANDKNAKFNKSKFVKDNMPKSTNISTSFKPNSNSNKNYFQTFNKNRSTNLQSSRNNFNRNTQYQNVNFNNNNNNTLGFNNKNSSYNYNIPYSLNSSFQNNSSYMNNNSNYYFRKANPNHMKS